MDHFEPDYYTDLNQCEEALITLRKDIKDIISESSIDKDVSIPSCCIKDEDWIKLSTLL